jgi:hypothetical protein
MSPIALAGLGLGVFFLIFLMYQSTYHPRTYYRYPKDKLYHHPGCGCGCQRRMHPAM